MMRDLSGRRETFTIKIKFFTENRGTLGRRGRTSPPILLKPWQLHPQISVVDTPLVPLQLDAKFRKISGMLVFVFRSLEFSQN